MTAELKAVAIMLAITAGVMVYAILEYLWKNRR